MNPDILYGGIYCMVYQHSRVTNLQFLLYKPYKLPCQILNIRTNI